MLSSSLTTLATQVLHLEHMMQAHLVSYLQIQLSKSSTNLKNIYSTNQNAQKVTNIYSANQGLRM